MPQYKSGKFTTGVSHGMEVHMAESGDKEAAKPKAKPGVSTFKAKQLPLNIIGPNSQHVSFIGGYYTTSNKDMIKFLKENPNCELQ